MSGGAVFGLATFVVFWVGLLGGIWYSDWRAERDRLAYERRVARWREVQAQASVTSLERYREQWGNGGRAA